MWKPQDTLDHPTILPYPFLRKEEDAYKERLGHVGVVFPCHCSSSHAELNLRSVWLANCFHAGAVTGYVTKAGQTLCDFF